MSKDVSFISRITFLDKNLNNIETPERPDRTQWVHDIGYKLWSTDEIRNGVVFKRFKERLGL